MANAVNLNGSSQYLTRVNSDELDFSGGTFAFSVWVYPDVLGANKNVLWKGTSSLTVEFQLFYLNSSGRWAFAVYDTSDTPTSIAAAIANTHGAVSTGAWQHIVCYYDDATKTAGIAVNGGTIDTATGSGTLDISTGDFRVGVRQVTAGPTYDQHFDGRIQDLGIWIGESAVPSADEVAWLYNSGSRRNWWELGRTGNGSNLIQSLACWFPLEEKQSPYTDVRRALQLVGTATPTTAAGPTGAAADNRAPVAAITNTGLTAGALATQTSDEGDTWTQHDTETQALTVSASGTIYSGGTATGTVSVATEIYSSDQRIEFDYEIKTNTGQAYGVMFKMQATTGSINAYMFRYSIASGKWQFYQVVAGSFTLLAEYTQALSTATVYSVRIETTRHWHQFWVDDELIMSVVNGVAAMHRGGSIGLRCASGTAGSATTGSHISNLTAKRGTWECIDVFLKDSFGGSDGSSDNFRIPNCVYDSSSNLLVTTERRLGGHADDRRASLESKKVNISSWPPTIGSEIAIDDETDAAYATGTKFQGNSPIKLPNGDLLVIYTSYDPGYGSFATGNVSQVVAGGEGDTDTAHIWMNRSQDGGSTWETPVEFTNDVKDTVNWNAMSTTSRAIVTSSGRVIIPIAHVDSSNEWYSELCYTDDFASGRPTLSTVTWNRGGDVGGVENNEASVFEAGSNLLVPFRQANNETTDKRYTSHSSVTTNDSSANYFPLMDHGVFTAFHKYRGVVLVAEIADEGPGFARRNPTLRWSEDNGATWNVPGEPATAYPWGTLVAHTGGQYTSVVADDNHVYIVFEKGYLSNVASIGDLTGAINLVRMPVSTLGITYATSGSALPIIMQLLGA